MIDLLDNHMIVVGAPQTAILGIIANGYIGFVNHVLVAFLHRSAGIGFVLRVFFRYILHILRRGGRELLPMVFLLRLGVGYLQVRIGLVSLNLLLTLLKVTGFFTISVRCFGIA